MLGLGLIGRATAEVRRDVTAAQSRDPAARGVSAAGILATWPGVHALLAHRFAHALHQARIPFVPRVIAAVARSLTGIEIHPAAQIGAGFFIDHGMGVVIGETAEIGTDVTLYQGVTLVQDNVTIGSGAKLLGPITIGHGARIGANTVVIHDVPPNSTVVGNPGHPVRVEGRRPEGPDADWIHLPDPVADAIKGLSSRIAALEDAADEAGAEVRPLRRAARGKDGRDGGPEAGGGDREGRANPRLGPNPAGG